MPPFGSEQEAPRSLSDWACQRMHTGAFVSDCYGSVPCFQKEKTHANRPCCSMLMVGSLAKLECASMHAAYLVLDTSTLFFHFYSYSPYLARLYRPSMGCLGYLKASEVTQAPPYSLVGTP